MWHIPLLAKWAIGATIAGLGFVGYEIIGVKKGVLTSERKLLFDALMRSNDPAKLRKYADTYDGWGLPDQAKQLRTRAAFLEAPPSTQQARQAVVNQAVSTTDPKKAPAVQNVANAFATSGDPGTAAALTAHAQEIAANQPQLPPGYVPTDYADDDPRSPNYHLWLIQQAKNIINPAGAGALPTATGGNALGDGLGAVKVVQGEAPAGHAPPAPVGGDHAYSSGADGGAPVAGDRTA